MTRTSAVATATQELHPWRASLRTAVAVLLGLITLIPTIAIALAVDPNTPLGGFIAQLVLAAVGFTRVLALPRVNAMLVKYRLTEWLAAEPAPPVIMPTAKRPTVKAPAKKAVRKRPASTPVKKTTTRGSK